MDNQNDQAGAAAPKPFSYEITPRAAHVGGGWRLQLFEGAFEVGGGVYPASDDAAVDDMYQEALSDGDAWLTSRGEATPPASTAPGAEPQNWADFIKGCGYAEVAPGSFRKPVVAPASADNPSTAGAVTDAMIEAARDAFNGFPCPMNGSAARGISKEQMRAGLEAAICLAAPVAQSTAGAAKPVGKVVETDIDVSVVDAVLPIGAAVYLAAPAAQAPAQVPTAAEVRDQALEEAARASEKRALHWQQQDGKYAAGKKAGAFNAADAIRALKASALGEKGGE